MILILGAVGNIFVVLVVKNKKKNRKIHDYFIFNLAISDLCMLIFSISVDFYLKFQASPHGNVLCKGIWPFMTTCLFASVFTLTCTAIERWRTIVKPFCPRLLLWKVYWVLILTWLAGIAFVSPLTVVAYHEGRGCKEILASFWYEATLYSRCCYIPICPSSVDYFNCLREDWNFFEATSKN